MMFPEFKASKAAPKLSLELQSLWHDAKGDWEKAHTLVQDSDTKDAAWVHAEESSAGRIMPLWWSRRWMTRCYLLLKALLHRKEGDTSNAGTGITVQVNQSLREHSSRSGNKS